MSRERIVLSRNLTPVPYGRRTEPTSHLYAGHEKVDLHHTDIEATFKRVRAELEKPAESPNVSPLHKRKHPSAGL